MTTKTAIDYVQEFGKDESSTIPLLQAIQNDYGYLPLNILEEICEESNIKKSKLYGVATFYSQFKLKPVGKNIIKICKGTACHVKGADLLIEALKNELNVQVGETTLDNKFTLETVACLGCCSLAPVIMINKDVYGKLTPNKVVKIIRDYTREKVIKNAKKS